VFVGVLIVGVVHFVVIYVVCVVVVVIVIGSCRGISVNAAVGFVAGRSVVDGAVVIV